MTLGNFEQFLFVQVVLLLLSLSPGIAIPILKLLQTEFSAFSFLNVWPFIFVAMWVPLHRSRGHALYWINPSYGTLDKMPCYFAMKSSLQEGKSISSGFGSGLAYAWLTIEHGRNDRSSCPLASKGPSASVLTFGTLAHKKTNKQTKNTALKVSQGPQPWKQGRFDPPPQLSHQITAAT